MKLKNLGNNGRIVSEKYVKFIGKHFYTKLELIPFHMRIMRRNIGDALSKNELCLEKRNKKIQSLKEVECLLFKTYLPA